MVRSPNPMLWPGQDSVLIPERTSGGLAGPISWPKKIIEWQIGDPGISPGRIQEHGPARVSKAGGKAG